jgi:hypothetical protein
MISKGDVKKHNYDRLLWYYVSAELYWALYAGNKSVKRVWKTEPEQQRY